MLRVMQVMSLGMRCTAATQSRGRLLGVPLGLHPVLNITQGFASYQLKPEDKFITVWEGYHAGVYASRDKKWQLIRNNPDIKYMGFATEREATAAFRAGPKAFQDGHGVYGVYSTWHTGVYASWQPASEQYLLYSGSRIKSFRTKEEAKEWLDHMREVDRLKEVKELLCIGFYGLGGTKPVTTESTTLLYNKATNEMYLVQKGAMSMDPEFQRKALLEALKNRYSGKPEVRRIMKDGKVWYTIPLPAEQEADIWGAMRLLGAWALRKMFSFSLGFFHAFFTLYGMICFMK